MNHAQNKLLHGLLNQKGLLENKANIISGITKGRTESSKGMDFEEARLMITWLQTMPNIAPVDPNKKAQDDKSNKMRRRIISMAHEMGWHNLVSGEWKIDMRGLNNWCLQHSYLKKELNGYSYQELPKLVSQFEMMYKSFLKKV